LSLFQAPGFLYFPPIVLQNQASQFAHGPLVLNEKDPWSTNPIG